MQPSYFSVSTNTFTIHKLKTFIILNQEMRFLNVTADFNHNDTTEATLVEPAKTIDVMVLLSAIIASVGIVANATVIFAFLNHKKLRGKIPNIFIINQVGAIFSSQGLRCGVF